MLKKNRQYIPFVIASFLVILHYGEVMISNQYVDPSASTIRYLSILQPVKLAAIGLTITLILILLKQFYWKLVFLILIMVSFTPLMGFSSHTYGIRFDEILIELIPLGLLTSHILLNPDLVKFMLRYDVESALEEDIELLESKPKPTNESLVKRFERKFSSKTKVELQDIVNENRLVPAAVEAAKRLLKNKTN